jgi:hypothetical protein
MSDERDELQGALESIAELKGLMGDFERRQQQRKVEEQRARFNSQGKLKKRPMSRNRLIASGALLREKLGPHAELWITYCGSRGDALRIAGDETLRILLPQTSALLDPEALNGYVAFEKRYAPRLPAGYQNLVQYIPVHGGITYAAKDDFAAVWGFDTMHYRSEREPRSDQDWIRASCQILYRGLLLAAKHWKEFHRAGRERRAEIAQELLDLVPEQEMREKLGFTALMNLMAGKIG